MALDAIKENLAGSDLIVSAFVSAITHYKRATLALPFPTEQFSTASNDKDYKSIRRAVDQLPSLTKLQSAEQLSSVPQKSRDLLAWLLAPSSRPVIKLRHISMEEFQWQVRQVQNSDVQFGDKMPTYIFEYTGNVLPTNNKRVVAFHGTSFERLHSILNTGLRPASGTRLQKNGAIFGEGVYLSTDLGVATSFCEAAEGWRLSALAWKMQVTLVCQVDDAETMSYKSGDLPQHYLLARHSQAVKISHILVYCCERLEPSGQDMKGKRPPAINWFVVVIIAYLACLLLPALLSNAYFQKRVWHLS